MLSLEQYIIQQYLEGKSLREINLEIPSYYPMKILRLLEKAGVAARDKSAAQTNAIKSGRSKPPRKPASQGNTATDRAGKGPTQGSILEDENGSGSDKSGSKSV